MPFLPAVVKNGLAASNALRSVLADRAKRPATKAADSAAAIDRRVDADVTAVNGQKETPIGRDGTPHKLCAVVAFLARS